MIFHHAFDKQPAESKETQLKEAIEKEAEIQLHDLADDTEKEEETVDDRVPETDHEQKFEEEEMAETITEEIFQTSEDGVTWKTVKKITTITPSGTTEKIIDLGGIRKQPPL